VDEAQETIRLIVVVAIVASIATFVVGVYVGVRWQRGSAARDLARLRRDMLAMYRAPPSVVTRSTSVAKFREYKDSYQHHNRTPNP
jgi:hypothetical protein